MPKIKNISGADRTVPGLGYAFVLAGQVVEVPADQVEGYAELVHDLSAKLCEITDYDEMSLQPN